MEHDAGFQQAFLLTEQFILTHSGTSAAEPVSVDRSSKVPPTCIYDSWRLHYLIPV
ncbi:hypothetical protein [Acidithiobacillus ferrianus]|uniref:hypothetical protein n=1 Tax=Acidithiobacillus ferrianus TaxID=2678518 RepID=UPI0034E590CC